jgi:hypothetical protein
LALSQAHPWAPATILVDELDARLFQGAAHRYVVRYRHRRLSLDELSPPDRRDPYSRCASQIFGAPTNKCSGSADLAASQQPLLHVDSPNTK